MSKIKRALFVCNLYWDTPFQVGSHQIAKGLLKRGWSVAFVSNPISPFHIAKGWSYELKDRVESYCSGGAWFENHHLYAYVPAALLTPARQLFLDREWLHRHWDQLSLPNIWKKLSDNGFRKVDLLYIDSVYYECALREIKYKKSVFRVADRQDAFSGVTKMTNSMASRIANQVDCVVYSAKSLEDYIHEMNPRKACYLPNGVDFSHFQEDITILPKEYEEIPKPRVIYVGAMKEWFDSATVKFLAQSLPKVSFVCIGDDEYVIDKDNSIKNIYFLGRKKYKDIPIYIRNSDVGLIPFDLQGNQNLIAHINPLKLYEYMACGLPVVSSSWRALELLQTPAKLYHTREEALSLLRNALQEPPNPQRYIDYAAQNTWDERVETLLKILELNAS
jgi:putative glycosyltransferase